MLRVVDAQIYLEPEQTPASPENRTRDRRLSKSILCLLNRATAVNNYCCMTSKFMKLICIIDSSLVLK